MAERVELAFRHAARSLLPRGSSVLVAVSGGGDSVALLHLIARYAAGQPLRITVGHLDHGLRPRSADDRRFVRDLAKRMGLPCISERRSVRRLRLRGESPEEAARRVRRDFLRGAAGSAGATIVATGHTLDDQAETVLFRLLRGAGPTALTGMADAGPGPFVRPLLRIERADLRAYLKRHRIPFLEDPSNEELRFDRNRLRRLVLPFLETTLNPRAARHLVQIAERLREDAQCLDDIAREALERATRRRGSALTVAAHALGDAPAPVGRRMARLALERAGVDPRRISARHVHALWNLARAAGEKSLDLPCGVRARRVDDVVVLRAARASRVAASPGAPERRRARTGR